MRVTGNTFTSSLVAQLNTLTSREYQLQNQISTGQRISAPEDDPAAVQRTLELQAQNSANTQYASNISALQSVASTAGSAISSLKTLCDKATEIATEADGTTNSAQLKTYASEVTQLIQQAAQLVNTQDSTGQYLFGGTKSDQPPFAVSTDASGNVTGVTYGGNTSETAVQIGTGTTLATGVPGANTTGSGPRGLVTDSRSGADLFTHLISLQNNLLAGNTTAISSTDNANLATDDENLAYHIGYNGVTQTRLETAATLATNQTQSLTNMITNESGVDMASALTDLTQTQNAYEAALKSSAGILNMSLLNYVSLS